MSSPIPRLIRCSTFFWRKCFVHNRGQFFRFIILHLSINVHRNFAVLMPRQVLNRFRICAGVNQIRDICVAQLVRSYLKIKGVHHISIMRCIFSQLRRYRVLNFLPIDIPDIGFYHFASETLGNTPTVFTLHPHRSGSISLQRELPDVFLRSHRHSSGQPQ